MNYQTKEVSNWLDKSGIVNSRREELIYNPGTWDDYEYKDEEDIDTSDIPELDENFWKKAQLVEPKTA